jgi:hypothetical protein
MIITKQISELAKEYGIDFSLSQKELANSSEDNVMQNMPINRLLDIKDELSAYTTLDGFYLYAKKHINDKSQIVPLTYSLLLLVETNIDQVKTQIRERKADRKHSSTIDKNSSHLNQLGEDIYNLENYQWMLVKTLAFFRREVDNLKNTSPESQKSTRRILTKSFVGLNWVGPRRLDLVNEIFQALHGQYLDPKTKYKDFDKLFLELSVDESFQSINWIHRGGAFSLRYLFFLLTQDSALLMSTKLNVFLSLTFTINNETLNPGTLRTYNSKIKEGRIPQYYADLEKQISKILLSAK